MRSYLPSVAAGIALAAMGGLAVAQDTAAPAPQEVPPGPPLYRVELIVFAYRDFDATEERFDHEQTRPAALVDTAPLEVPQFDDTNFLLPGATPPGATPDAVLPTNEPPSETTEPDQTVQAETPAEDAFRFRLLTPEEYQLDAAYKTLERIPAYVPLLHGGWLQPGLPDGETQPVDLALLGSLNPTGTVRVYLSRFLHVELDLTYRGGPGGGPSAAPATELDSPDTLRAVSLAPRYRLQTQRQVRSGELHYFDHPAFGVLVTITPAPVAPETPDAKLPGRPAA
jgi:Peptidoglycan-binding protein, CsiV